jgi:hypothetical protein
MAAMSAQGTQRKSKYDGTMDKIAMLSEILKQNPADAFARYGLAMAYAAEGKLRRRTAGVCRDHRAQP